MHFDHSLTSPPTPNQAQVSPAQLPTKTEKLSPNLGIYYTTLFPGRRDHCGSRIRILRARDSGWLRENCSLDAREQPHVWTHCQWCKACGPMQVEARRSIQLACGSRCHNARTLSSVRTLLSQPCLSSFYSRLTSCRLSHCPLLL